MFIFALDVSCNPEYIKQLKKRFKVPVIGEEKESDESILKRALENGCNVLVTNDKRFGYEAALNGLMIVPYPISAPNDHTRNVKETLTRLQNNVVRLSSFKKGHSLVSNSK